MNIAKLKQLIIFVMTTSLILLLSGCATYKSSFTCGDAKGAYCASMDYVDQMIDSGEIEQFNERRLNRKHKSGSSLPLRAKVTPAEITNFEVMDAQD